ncbi:MAG TPA: alpha/beta hydrolase [Ohtaekwangia sp.]
MTPTSFQSKIFIVPGLGNSEETHWQTLWENQFGFTRIQQREWETPDRDEWIETIDKTLKSFPLDEVVLVGHSLACTTIAAWSQRYGRKIKGALLVAPSDTEADTYPPGTTGFKPMCLHKFPFPVITVTSSDDYYVTLQRAELFATAWGGEFVNVGALGHINVASGFGKWDDGLQFLSKLDK